jgi:hypothetical protein
MKYQINGPEGYPIHPEGYETLDEMVRAAAKFILRFVHQGCYIDTRMTRQTLDWAAENLSAETYSVTAPEAYVRYIQENLERIGRDGWVPVCYEEFLGSEECNEIMRDGEEDE